MTNVKPVLVDSYTYRVDGYLPTYDEQFYVFDPYDAVNQLVF